MKANTCPYCGGPYTIDQTCNGPRTDTPGENACHEMQAHVRQVEGALDEPLTEQEEAERVSADPKVGDQVVCIDDSASFNRLREGRIYAVTAAYDGTPTVEAGGSYHDDSEEMDEDPNQPFDRWRDL